MHGSSRHSRGGRGGALACVATRTEYGVKTSGWYMVLESIPPPGKKGDGEIYAVCASTLKSHSTAVLCSRGGTV